MAGETPAIPQDLSSNLAKGTLPDVIAKSNINWTTVKKVDHAFDTIPPIKARGAELVVDKDNFPSPDNMREATKIKVGEKETNLVDHVLQDEQLRIILQEGMRLNILNEADFKNMGLEPKNFQKGETANLKIPGLNRLQKSEAISLVLQRLGESNSKTTSLFLDEASKLVLNTKNVKLLNEVGGTLDNQDLINALATGGREELNKYIVEQGYEPFAIGEEAPLRRVMAKLVSKDYSKEGAARVLKETTPFFADHKDVKLEDGTVVEKVGVPEYSALVDMRVAQAMTNSMMPPEFHLTVARIESKIAGTTDVSKVADLRHEITRTKQKAYMALMNVYGVKGFEEDGEAFQQYGFELKDQRDVLRMAKTIKESARFKETQNMTMFEANRYSLAEVASKVSGISINKLKGVVAALPIEQMVENSREQARANMVSENIVEDTVRGQLAESFIETVSLLGKKDLQLTASQKKSLGDFFLRTYDTERSMLSGKGSLRNFSNADGPTKVKIGTPEAVNMGAKGLKLLFDRTITEQRYDFETYKKELIEGAAEVQTPKTGTELQQGQMQVQAQATEEAETARAEEEAAQIAKVDAQRIEAEKQEELTKYHRRSPSESLAVENIPNTSEGEVYVNELMQKIYQDEASSDEINDEMIRLLKINPEFAGLYRGPLKMVKEAALKKQDPVSFMVYEGLKKAKSIAQQWEAIPSYDADAIDFARSQFFVPHKEEE